MLYYFLLYNKVNQLYVNIYTPLWSSLPPPTPSHPSRSSQSRAELPVLQSRFSLATCFMYGNVHVSVLISQPSLPHCVHMSLLYVHVSLPALQICSSVPSFQIPHIYVLFIFYYSLFVIFFKL